MKSTEDIYQMIDKANEAADSGQYWAACVAEALRWVLDEGDPPVADEDLTEAD